MSVKTSGKFYGWSDITIRLPSGDLKATNIEYGDEQEKEIAYGMGNMPRGYGTGNYKANCKFSMLLDDYEELEAYCRDQGVGLYKLVIPKIVVAYSNDDEGRTRVDEITQVGFTKVDNKAAQGDKNLPVEIECCVFGKIIRDGVNPM